MARIHIDKLEVTGKNQNEASTIEFAENLTIIIGKSQLGKTMIYKCIDYLFGASNDDKHKPFLPKTGYDTIVGYFTTDIGSFKIVRELDSNEIEIIDNNNECQKYNIDSSQENWLGNFWNKVLGIEQNFQVPSNKDGKPRSFSWRSIKQIFMLWEKKANTDESILYPKETTTRTGFLSELLYLLYKEDLSEYQRSKDANTQKIEQAAVRKYINFKREEIQKKRENLAKITKQGEDVNEILEKLQEKLNEINEALYSTVKDSQNISKRLISLEQTIKELEMVINRYDVLESQYQADIERINLIVDGEKTLINMPIKETKCPFCENNIKTSSHTSYIKVAKDELNQTILNLNELHEVRQNILEKLNLAKEEKEQLLKDQKEKSEMISSSRFIQTSIKNQIKECQDLIEIKTYDEIYSRFENDYKDNIDKINKKIVYRPRNLFSKHQDFVFEIKENYEHILSEFGFPLGKGAKFDLNSFDVIVDNDPKPSWSKGYQCIINSSLFFAFRKYFNDVAKINPHFYIFDSPLATLMTETKEEYNNKDLRKNFFKYCFDNYGEDQIIIIENTDYHEMPDISKYDSKKVKIYEFTGEEGKNSRYGFLKNYYGGEEKDIIK